MKIAFILYHFPVLSETFILNQITGLIDRGHDVHIFCKSPYRDKIHHAEVDRYNLMGRTCYYRTSDKRLPENKIERVVKAARLLVSHLNRKPLPLLKALDFFTYGRMASSLGIFYTTVPFLEKNIHEYDIAHCHFGPNGDLAALLRNLGAFRGKIVTTFHGEAGYTDEKKYEKGFKRLFEAGDLFLPMSEREKQTLIDCGCNPRKVVVHRMGIDTGKFAGSPHKAKTNGSVQLLTVGRLVEKKGVEYGIQCVAKVAKKYPNIEYKVAGDGPLRSDLQGLIDQLNINDKVTLLGSMPQEKVVELIKTADLFLAPSVYSKDGDQEGVPVVIMEAMAQGLPVLSTHHAGIPELVQDGVSGFLVPERDVDALAGKLDYLLEHQELWDTMGQAGRDYIEKFHDINKLNDRLVGIFQGLLNGKCFCSKKPRASARGILEIKT
ncbi:MAG: glycosyltransferase [Pseudomonadota bacterium]